MEGEHLISTSRLDNNATPRSDSPASPNTRHIAQIVATTMTRILKLSQHFASADIVNWWNDIVALIDTVISTSTLDPYVAFGAMPLLERYVQGSDQTAHSLDTYRLFVGSLIVTSKIVRPRRTVPWNCIIGERFMGESVAWMEREFLITVSWDRCMMEIVDEVWNAYDQALDERLGDPCRARNIIGRDRKSVLSWGSSVTSTGHSGTYTTNSYSMLFPPLLLNSPVSSRLPNTRSTLWEEYMSNRTRPATSGVDMDEYLDLINTAPYVPAEKVKPNNSRILRTKLSTFFGSG